MRARPRTPRLRLAVRGAAIVAVAGAALALADPAAAPTTDTLRPTPIAAVPAHPVPADGSAASTLSGAGSTGAGSTGSALPESAPVRVRVPSAGIDAPTTGLGLRPDGSLDVPSEAPTAGWFTGGPTPGETGPAVIAAHVNWRGRPGAFASLGSVRRGAQVLVDRADGDTAVFVVDLVREYPKSVFPTGDVYGDLDHPGLRLITCGGDFSTERRSYRDNIIVFASLRT